MCISYHWKHSSYSHLHIMEELYAFVENKSSPSKDNGDKFLCVSIY